MYFFKNQAENEAERIVPDLFLFFKNALNEVEQVICTLVSISFNSSRLGRTIKRNCIKDWNVDLKICSVSE